MTDEVRKQLAAINAKLDTLVEYLVRTPVKESLAGVRHLTLTRVKSGPAGTFGLLTDSAGEWETKTVERPWLDNKPNVSCIPVGEYEIHRHNSPRFGDCCIIRPTAPRTHILIHVANFASDVKGCIGVGCAFSVIGGKPAVAHSRRAFGELMSHLWQNGNDPWTLTITEDYDG